MSGEPGPVRGRDATPSAGPAGRLWRLPTDQQGDEGVGKMLILLLVTVPIVLVLVLFGGKIVDEFQVGLCNLGVVDPPEWYVRDRVYYVGDGQVLGRDEREWTAEECAMYRYAEDDPRRLHPEIGE